MYIFSTPVAATLSADFSVDCESFERVPLSAILVKVLGTIVAPWTLLLPEQQKAPADAYQQGHYAESQRVT